MLLKPCSQLVSLSVHVNLPFVSFDTHQIRQQTASRKNVRLSSLLHGPRLSLPDDT